MTRDLSRLRREAINLIIIFKKEKNWFPVGKDQQFVYRPEVSKKVEAPKPSNIYEKLNEVDENGDWLKLDMKAKGGVSGVDKGDKDDLKSCPIPQASKELEAGSKGDSLGKAEGASTPCSKGLDV